MGEGSPPRAGSLRARPAAGLDGTTVPAQAAEVVSSNIVGYTKVSVPAGLSIIGQNFSAVGGGDCNIQTIRGEGLSDGGTDMLQLWTGSGYDYCYYYSAADDINGDGSAAWGDESWTAVDLSIGSGTGMWMQSQQDATIVFAGEVGEGNTKAFSAGLTLASQTIPMDINIQDVQGEGLADGGVDMIQIWNGSSYDYYYYYSAADDINGDGTAAWGDESWTPVDVTLYAGQGFWLQTQGAGTLTFPAAP